MKKMAWWLEESKIILGCFTNHRFEKLQKNQYKKEDLYNPVDVWIFYLHELYDNFDGFDWLSKQRLLSCALKHMAWFDFPIFLFFIHLNYLYLWNCFYYVSQHTLNDVINPISLYNI